VWGLIAGATDVIRKEYRLAEEEGKTVWWWPGIMLVARKGT